MKKLEKDETWHNQVLDGEVWVGTLSINYVGSWL